MPRGQAGGRREKTLSRDRDLPGDDAAAAFLDAVRGRPAPRIGQVRALDDAELIRMTGRLRRLKSECGCKAGAWSMTAALIAAPAVAAVHGASGPVGLLMLALLSAAAVIGAAVAGKVITVAVYRLRWRIERDRMLRQLAGREVDRDVVLR